MVAEGNDDDSFVEATERSNEFIENVSFTTFELSLVFYKY